MEKNKLVSNTQPKSLKEILNDVLQEKRNVQVWKMFLDKKWMANYQLIVVRTRTEEIVFELQDGSQASIENAKKILAHEEEARFWVPSIGILFSSKIIYCRELELVTKFPKFFAHQDRRKSLRLKITDQPVMASIPMDWGGLNQTTFRDKIPYDLSAGGFSFIVIKDESSMFKNGVTIPSVVITIDSRPCVVAAKVVTIVTISPTKENGLFYESLKICFVFEEIDENDRLHIDNYVMTAILKEGDKAS